MDYPKYFFISSGIGASQHKLVAFDNALIHAGISNYNLIKISSVLPASCIRKNRIDLKYGSPLLTAYAVVNSHERGRHIAAAVAVGIPSDPDHIGIIMEASGESAADTEDVAKAMVDEAMRNHHIQMDHIEASSAEGMVADGWLSVIAAISIW